MNRWGFHGDVIFEEDKLPKKAKLIASKVLQGSTTAGHEHVIKKGKHELRKEGDSLFLVAKEAVVIGMKQASHKHKDVTCPKGVWRIRIALETDHIAGVVRAVAD